MKTITKDELNKLKGFKILISKEELETIKKFPKTVLLYNSNVPDYRFDHIEMGENFITVHDSGIPNPIVKNGFKDSSTTWTTTEWDKQPWDG